MKVEQKLFMLVIFLLIITPDLYGQLAQKLNVTKLDNPYPGYLIFDFPQKSPLFGLDNYGNLIVNEVEDKGCQFVYQLKNGLIALFLTDTYYLYNENLQLIDSIQNPTQFEADFHDFISLSNGNYLMIVNEYRTMDMSQLVDGGQKYAQIKNNILIETDRNGNIFWSWSSLDYLDILDATSDVDLTQVHIDYAHINSMFEDDNGNILISIRHFDEISLIDKSTGNFLWRMGGTYCKNNQFTIVSDSYNGFTGFSHQHTPSILPNGNLLLFDNGNLKSPRFSRVVEYSLNYSNKTATKVWEYRRNPDVYCSSMGGVVRLANGNSLINWNSHSITEVKQDKSIALEITQTNMQPIYRVYKSKLLSAFSSQNISGKGEYNFTSGNSNTGVKIDVTSISSNATAYIHKHNYPPITNSYNSGDIQSTLPFRWVFTTDNTNSYVSGDIIFDVESLGNNIDANSLTIFKRNVEGVGDFQILNTTFNSFTKELRAPFSGWGEFIIGRYFLTTPTLLKPENNSFVQLDAKISWSAVSDADNYKLEIGKDSTFQTVIISDYFNTTSHMPDFLEHNTKYFWRVKALNPKIESEWSLKRSFTTIVAPPTLIEPNKLSNGVRNGDKLIWEKVNGATKYQLQLSTDSNFIYTLVNDNNIINTFFTPIILNYYTKYFWRVRAINNTIAGNWSEVYSFTSIIAPPENLEPANNSINFDFKNKFSWKFVEGAENYIFEISSDENFNNIISAFDLTKTETMVTNLEFDRTYFWRVRSVRSVDTSDWSAYNKFETLLHPIYLSSPFNKSTNEDVNPFLVWDSKQDSAKHLMQISTDESFEIVELELYGISNKFYKVDELKAYTKYFWRVKAYVGERLSSWSDVYSFTTGKGFELRSPKLLLPKNNSETFTDISIHWQKSLNAISYQFQLSLSDNFDEIVYETSKIKENSLSLSSLIKNKNYYWRVKSFSKFDSSGWSEAFKFNVIKGFNSVTLHQPGNEELQTPLSTALVWKKFIGADSYEVQLAQNYSFDNTILNVEIQDTIVNFDGLKHNTVYYWRVRFIKQGYVSDWSNIWSFSTITSNKLEAPAITSHIDGSVAIKTKGTISWDSVPNATEYTVAISTSSNFSSNFIKKSGIKEFKIEYENLEYNTIFYVRVSASNENSQSNWSKTIKFTTELEAPKIVTPADGDVNVASSGTISWSENDHDYLYAMQISLSESFDILVTDTNSLENSYINFNLENNTNYFCRVRTYNDSNYSDWSSFIKFKTQNLSSIDNDEFCNNEYAIFPNPAHNSININSENEINQIAIFDIYGNKVTSIDNNCNQSIDISRLPIGTYYLRVGSKFLKFIKI